MFKVNDIVVHYRDGLAVITGTANMSGIDYFTLKAKRTNNVAIYVPVANATKIIRPVMDKENADGILMYMLQLEEEFNANTKQRRDDFKRRIASGNILDIVYLVKQLYLYQTAEQLPEKVKFGPVDFDILESAKNMLLDELAITYDVDRDKVTDYIDKKMKELAKNM
jgi:RNA polymerase-interacting CarD/CdnL/TRCF family regulator